MKKITVTFNLEFGSQFQEGSFERILKALLEGVAIHTKQNHKGNKISYEIDTNDGYKTKKY